MTKVLHATFYDHPHQGRTHRNTTAAFPKSCEYACPVEKHRSINSVKPWLQIGAIFMLGFVVGALYV